MKHVLGALGVAAAGVLLAVSAAMNWRFGYSLGKTEMDGQIYGAASAAADCFKALVPFFFFAAIRNRMWSQVAAAAVLWVVVTGYSLTSALGHAALNRLDTTGKRAVDAQSYKDLRADLKSASDQLGWVPPHRPAQTVQGEIDGLKNQRTWAWSKECTAVNGKSAREFCDRYHALSSEHASAGQADKLEVRKSEIMTKLAGVSSTSSMSEADPQAAVLSKLAVLVFPSMSIDNVQTALTIFVALLLEIGSGFGMYVAFSQWRIYDRAAPALPRYAAEPSARDDVTYVAPAVTAAIAPPKARIVGGANDNRTPAVAKMVAPETDVERYRKERTEGAEGSSLTATSLYEDYCAWCEEQQKEPLALPTFGREFGELGGIQKAKIAGRVRYIAIALKSGEAKEDGRRPADRIGVAA